MFNSKSQTKQRDNTSQAINIIGEESVIEGNLVCKGALRIDGTVYGDVETESKLLLSPKSKVIGNIKCNLAEVCGVVEGNIQANEMVSIAETAKVKGDIFYTQIQISPGAQLESKLTQVKGKTERITEVKKGNEENAQSLSA